MLLRCDRPATPSEQQAAAQIPEPSDSRALSELRGAIAASWPERRSRAKDWTPVLVATIGLALVIGFGWWVRSRQLLPAGSRQMARETLSAMVELRQATGRIPLRYITEFERAGVVRSGFDNTDQAEKDLLANLRRAVERAPEREAVLTLGLLVLDEGELDEAELLLTRVLEEVPDSVDALNGLAVVSYERAQRIPSESYGHLQEGLALLRRAEAYGADDVRVLYNYGKFYDALEMPSAAEKSRARYLEVDRASQWGEEALFDQGR